MSIVDLKARIDSYAAGPSGTAALVALMARPSPVDAICGAFEILAPDAATLEGEPLALLRDAASAIVAGQWHGKAQAAAGVLAALPPPQLDPAPSDDPA